MYNEQTNFSIKNVILQFLFVALFIFILIWLFPLKSDLTKAVNSNNNTTVNVDLSALTDRIFNENIIAMKDAAKSYYTTPRLPKNVGDKVKMTLKQMLDKKIILPFTDKNGKACDTEASYVEITKYDEEFIMKVNLKCGKEENYLLVYMGCYDYCQTALCEKHASDVKAPVVYGKGATGVKTVTPVSNNTTNTTVNTTINTTINKVINIVNPTPQPQPEQPIVCGIKDGKYFGKDGKETTKEEYEKQCVTKNVEYLYEYKKTTDGYYTESGWSDWSTNAVSASSTVSVRIKTIKENKLVGYNVTREYDYNSPIYGTKVVNTGSETILVCNNWGYVSSGSSKASNGEWSYAGLVTLYSVPTNTSTVKYEFVRFADETCKESCSSTTGMIYKKYVAGLTSVDLSTYECTSSSYQTIALSTTVSTITGYNTKVTKKEPVYQTVESKLYSYKTRSYVAGTTDIKWSKYNDTTLLNAGYKYTGNKKVK